MVKAVKRGAAYLHHFSVVQLIVAVNKMDDISVNYSKERYDEIKAEVSRMLRMVGFKMKKSTLYQSQDGQAKTC